MAGIKNVQCINMKCMDHANLALETFSNLNLEY